MSNKCEFTVGNIISDNHESIRLMSTLNITEKQINKSNILDFLNKETVLVVASPKSNLFKNYEFIDVVCNFNGFIYYFNTVSDNNSCELTAFIDKNLDNDTVFLINCESLKVSKVDSVRLKVCIDNEKVLKLKV